jgi:hypothetical protein
MMSQTSLIMQIIDLITTNNVHGHQVWVYIKVLNLRLSLLAIEVYKSYEQL